MIVHFSFIEGIVLPFPVGEVKEDLISPGEQHLIES
jgi:hypothetical protein